MPTDVKYVLQDLKVGFRQDVRGRYFTISLSSGQKIISHQWQVINAQLPPHIIPPEKRESNNKITLYYRINALISLASCLEKEMFSGEELGQILRQISHSLLHSKNQLLFATSFLLSPENIYIAPKEKKVFLLYVPLPLVGNINDNFQNLVRMVASTVADFPPELILDSETANFNVLDFHKRVSQRKLPILPNGQKAKEKEKSFSLVSETQLSPEEQGTKDVPPHCPMTLSHTAAFFLGSFQVLFLAILFLLAPWLNTLGRPVTTYGGLFLLLTAFDLLLFRYFAAKQSRESKEKR